MRLRGSSTFTTVRTEGAILPPDLLQRIVEGDIEVKGLNPTDYHLAPGERINEAINRSWNRLQGAWASFKPARDQLQAGDPGTGLTRDRWLLLIFQELGFGRLVPAKSVVIDGKAYPISHIWQNTPIHLVGIGVELDKRAPGVAGAARSSPHSLVQEFLNRSREQLWGLVSNGLRLRVLRDNASLVRQAFVEFDLESMMEGEVYSDFVLLWLLCHQSRVEIPPNEGPEECWLEKWSKSAAEQGARALEGLRLGVENAISQLGVGFIVHPANGGLRDELRTGTISTQDFYRQLLRLCYRIIFLFVAEDRELLLDPEASEAVKERYMRFFSTRRLRQIAGSRLGTKHSDLFAGLELVMRGLGSDEGSPALALAPFGSFLWADEAIQDIGGSQIDNRHLLEAVRALAFGVEGGIIRPVDYRNLGSEELGSIYESLLELHVEMDIDAGQFLLTTAGGHERRTSGSYYTPTPLISELLDSALDPLIREAASKPNPEEALLSLKVVDPATGSGHFLIAAAHRIAKAVAAVRTGEDEPSPDSSRSALRDVLSRCIYGVDVNEMAVELCKVSLWMEALEPGKPLSFLDHRIRCGNSLLGTTPALIEEGIPEEAFKPIEGDDTELCGKLKARNRKERAGQGTLEIAVGVDDLRELSKKLGILNAIGDSSIKQIRQKEQAYADFRASSEASRARMVADGWCAAFFGRKAKNIPAVTEGVLWQLKHTPDSVDSELASKISRLSTRFRFFHWHLEFPDVFPAFDTERNDEVAEPSQGGFDVVLSNPPWEHTELKEQEWFARRNPEIAAAAGAKRKKMIASLAEEDPLLHLEFRNAIRESEAFAHFLRNSGRYPLCGRGRINTYAVFAEGMRNLIGPAGRLGCIVPTGIATDHTTQYFFRDLVQTKTLSSIFGFENEEFLFPAVHHAFRFCLLTITGPLKPVEQGDFVFFARRVDHLKDDQRRFTLAPEDIALLNPNTLTCPIFRLKRDARIATDVYRAVPVLLREENPRLNPWGVSFRQGIFNMASDSSLFMSQADLEGDGWTLEGNVFSRDSRRRLPLYEAKMFHHFDHRFGTYEGQTESQANQGKLPEFTEAQHADPSALSLPRYWVDEGEVRSRLEGRWKREWIVGWRDITGTEKKRTVIATILPLAGAGHTIPLIFPSDEFVEDIAILLANLDSFALDYLSRLKVGGTHLTFFLINQLPIFPPETYARATPWDSNLTLRNWFKPRCLELVYSSWDLLPWARDVGYEGPPFQWNRERRLAIRCELDAAFFHLYGINLEDVDYIMETFPVVRRDDMREFEDYRSKSMIMEMYDSLDKAITTGDAYETPLDPPPADRSLVHASGAFA